MYLQRLVAGRAGLARIVFEDGAGEPADAGSVTVDITRDDATVVATARAATESTDEVGLYTVPLSAAELAQLDLLTLTWHGTVASVPTSEQSLIEVCGGRTCTLGYARKLRGLDRGTSATDLDDAITAAEQALEDECAVAFVPRYAHTTIRRRPSGLLVLPHRRVRTLRKVVVDGLALTSDQVAALTLEQRHGIVRGISPAVPRVREQVEVIYEHGWPSTPGRVGNAIRLLARPLVFESQVDPRVVRMRDSDGHETFYSAPGVRGIVFGIPEVEGVVTEYSERGPLI